MIETLEGIRETVNFKEIKGFMLYDNVDFESYPSHWHTPIELLMPLKNIYYVDSMNTSYCLNEGDILFINSGVIHSMSAIEGERLIFQADFSMLHNISDLESVLNSIPPTLLITADNAPDIHGRLKDLMLQIQQEYFSDSVLVSASIYSMMIEMFVLIGRKYMGEGIKADVTYNKQKEYTAKFIYISRYIQEHCTEDLTLDEAAALAGFSKYHFTRLFKSFTGNSFYKYLNRKRIEQAEKLLVDPEISITEVALQSGFSSLSAFIRMFKIVKGCTPTEFRNLFEE